MVNIRTYLHLVAAGRTTSFDEVTSHPQALAALFWPCWPPRFPTILASAPAATAKLKTQVYDRVGVYCNVNERDVATVWNDETLKIFTPAHALTGSINVSKLWRCHCAQSHQCGEHDAVIGLDRWRPDWVFDHVKLIFLFFWEKYKKI